MDGRPLRIAHFSLGRVNPHAADGIDRAIYHLAAAEATRHAVRLYSVSNKPPIPVPGVTVRTFPSFGSPKWLSRRIWDLFVWRSPLNLPSSLVRELMDWSPDMLHLHGVHVPQHLRLARAARAAGIPYCVTLHGMLRREARRRHSTLKRLVRRAEREFLQGAVFVHTLSDDEAGEIGPYGNGLRLLVVPNGVAADAGLPAPGTPLHHGPARFVYLGRLDIEAKGLDLMLEGFARARLEGAKLSVAGPNWRDGLSELLAQAAGLDVDARVEFPGAVFGDEKRRLLEATDVYVQTSRWEGVSFSVLEAAALGLPLLLTRPADPGGCFQRNAAAVVVDSSAEGIAAGFRAIDAMSAAQRSELGRRAHSLVRTEFSWESVAARLVQGYRHPEAIRRTS